MRLVCCKQVILCPSSFSIGKKEKKEIGGKNHHNRRSGSQNKQVLSEEKKMNAIVIYEVKQAELSDVQGLGLERERERTRIMLGFLASITE